MKRKFLKAVLFSVALATVSGTFVSCKDYDDDIKDLQEQINQKALASDVTALQSSLQSALSTAQSALAEAQKKADATDVAALEKRVAALEAAMKEVENLKKEIEEASAKQLAELQEKFETMKAEIEEMVGSMITSIELYCATDQAGMGGHEFTDLTVLTATEVDNVFGPNKDVEFKKGNIVTYAAEPVVVRVQPTNADLTKAALQLVNSQGATLDEFTTITAKAFETKKPLTRTAGNGLWDVTVNLKPNFVAKDFVAATTLKVDAQTTKAIRFALAACNTTDADRKAITAYDLTIGTQEAAACANLDFTVNDTVVAKIHNRYTTDELAWKDGKAAAAIVKDPANTVADANDDRKAMETLRVQAGEAIDIVLTEHDNEKIKGFYVVLDIPFVGKGTTGEAGMDPTETSVSEINAWNSYTYAGLNKYIDGTEGTIKVENLGNVVTDVIGFRVYAVNVNGTLIDPDGKAFYVVVANKDAAYTIEGVATIAKNGADFETDFIALDNDKLKAFGTVLEAWSADKGTPEKFDVLLFAKDKKTAETDLSKAAFAKLVIKNANASKFADNGTFSMSEILAKSADHGADQMLVKAVVTKKMPTAAPAGWSAKDKQIVNGTWTVYMNRLDSSNKEAYTISTATPANEVEGHKYLENAFNGLEDPNYIFSFATSIYNEKAKDYADANDVTGADYSLLAANELVDNKTAHATTVTYNYGLVSSVKDNKGNLVPYIVDVEKFNTVYACWYEAQGEWAWQNIMGKDAEGKDVVVTPATNKTTYGHEYKVNLKTLASTNAYNNEMFSGDLSKLLTAVYLKFEGAKVTSDVNNEEEYFTFESNTNDEIVFKPVRTDAEANPTATVKSTLTITVSDMFGHKMDIKLPVDVERM
ncbi:MAG: DUF3450 domain-containing protein [Bacteroidaceae bacterium]|nr:DUF3450 domain-containing protein [Bacteroidaceae bacterium]